MIRARVRRAWSGAVRGLAVAVVGVGVLVAPGVALGAGDANRAQCGGETEASPGFRSYLPDCRGYELVTPPYKGSTTVRLTDPTAISADGSHFITGVGGAFAGAGNDWYHLNGNPGFDAYEFTRTASGWAPTALTPPATQFPHSAIMAASKDLGSTLWRAATSTALFNEDVYLRDGSGRFLPVGLGVAPGLGDEELGSGDALEFAGSSRDLTHTVLQLQVFTSGKRALHDGHNNVWPGDTTREGGESLYEYVYTGSPSPEPTLVGVSNLGPLASDSEARLISDCSTRLGSAGQSSAYNAVSEDGEVVFFTALACEGAPVADELYARVGGSRTVAISEPSHGPEGDCADCDTSEPAAATFEGASANGSRVFFLTDQPLLHGDGDHTTDIYEYDFNAPAHEKIIQVSGGGSGDATPGSGAQVQGVVRVSEDGSHVYFVAKGVLAGENAEGHLPEQAADNLYVFDTATGRTTFVATLLTSVEEAAIQAGEVEEQAHLEALGFEEYFTRTAAAEHQRERGEISVERERELLQEAEAALEKFFVKFFGGMPGTRGPSGTLGVDRAVWGLFDDRPVQTTPDGRFLVFPSSAKLTADDTSSSVPQLFEYDVTRGQLTRISIGQGGAYNNNGNVDTFYAAPQISRQDFLNRDFPTTVLGSLAISGNGARVFFTSAAGLTPQAVAGDASVYEYRDGNVYLISDGHDGVVYESGFEPAVHFVGTDPLGRDAMFLTVDQLVPQDGETQSVLYDAREEGGFPAPVLASGCVGETCRGSSGATPQLGSAGSASQLGGGNLTPPGSAKPVVKLKPKSTAKERRLVRALRVCSREPKRKRLACARRVKKRFVSPAPTVKSRDRRGK